MADKKNLSKLIEETQEAHPEVGKEDVKNIIVFFIANIIDNVIAGHEIIIKNFIKLNASIVKEKVFYSFKNKKNERVPKRRLPKASFSANFVKKIKKQCPPS